MRRDRRPRRLRPECPSSARPGLARTWTPGSRPSVRDLGRARRPPGGRRPRRRRSSGRSPARRRSAIRRPLARATRARGLRSGRGSFRALARLAQAGRRRASSELLIAALADVDPEVAAQCRDRAGARRGRRGGGRAAPRVGERPAARDAAFDRRVAREGGAAGSRSALLRAAAGSAEDPQLGPIAGRAAVMVITDGVAAGRGSPRCDAELPGRGRRRSRSSRAGVSSGRSRRKPAAAPGGERSCASSRRAASAACSTGRSAASLRRARTCCRSPSRWRRRRWTRGRRVGARRARSRGLVSDEAKRIVAAFTHGRRALSARLGGRRAPPRGDLGRGAGDRRTRPGAHQRSDGFPLGAPRRRDAAVRRRSPRAARARRSSRFTWRPERRPRGLASHHRRRAWRGWRASSPRTSCGIRSWAPAGSSSSAGSPAPYRRALRNGRGRSRRRCSA